MNVLGLDLSKSSTGFCLYREGRRKPMYGYRLLGTSYTPLGGTCRALYQLLDDIHSVEPFDAIFYEDALPPGKLKGKTNANTIKIATGLAAHVESWAETVRIRKVMAINISSWRIDFLGRQPQGTKTPEFKRLAMMRCRQLGLSPRRDDEADAIGICTYGCLNLGITPPWLRDETLRPILEVSR